jgi:anti-sigma factor RsiW
VRHPRKEIALYADGMLSPAERTRVTEHVVSCGECRAFLAEVERGVEAARSLEIAPLPARRALAIRKALLDAPVGHERQRSHAGPRAAALAAVLALGALAAVLLLQGRAPRFRAASGQPLAFEELAIAAHEETLQSGAGFDIASGDAGALRLFLRSHQLGVSLHAQPFAASPPLTFFGARLVPGGRGPVGLVSYRVDGRAASLVVTPEAFVPDVPRWSRLAKVVTVRHTAGLTVLTWRNSGNVYAAVTELSDAGERACFACHTDAERRRVITAAARGLANSW